MSPLNLINDPTFSDEKEKAFLSLVKIAEERKDDYQYFVFAERALNINPVNNNLRFKVAYKYVRHQPFLDTILFYNRRF